MLRSREQLTWLARLTAEHDNFAAALRSALAARDTDTGLRLVAALAWFWIMRDYETEAGEWATAVREMAGGSAPPALADAYAICQILAVISAAAQAEDAPATLLLDTLSSAAVLRSLLPWIIVCVILLIWGTGWFKSLVNPIFTWNYLVGGLHNVVQKVPPVVAKPLPEAAVFAFTYISFTGSGMLLAAIISGFVMGFSPAKLVIEYGRTIKICAYSLITISAMLAIGTLTRYSGIDATLGLAFAGAGVLYPFFGTLLGWLGVALTGSDTASNVLFGGLQKITAEQLGLSPILMSAANSSGGVMGKMIDAQSIVVASTATNWFGHEGSILRFVFFHSIALACLVGILVTLQAYVFTGMIVH